ncbi:SDR family NAD(P)-dependent oxidoreductase [Aeromicrobium sp. CF3.5]|uniref:SDR family NAD(P)-dependent oxidoreductase n=1 Tax=Aeromicrobium sp. CF3.5 TaxID=3373078 RepID=UPI003EE4D035
MTGPLQDTTVLVTGASDGIGAEAARHFAAQGAHVLVTGRSTDKLKAIAGPISAESFVADFSRLDDVRQLSKDVAAATDRIDVLVNNAGGTFSPDRVTADGHEPNFQINHLAPFLLTHLLRPNLAAAGGALVLNTSSVGNLIGSVDLDDLDWRRRRANEFRCYGTGKLMNIMFTRGIARRWADDRIASAAVHPGPVGSSFGRDSALVGLIYRSPLKRFATISVPDGAAPLIALAERGPSPEINGVYFSRFTPNGKENKQAADDRLIDGLWATSADLVGVPT